MWLRNHPVLSGGAVGASVGLALASYFALAWFSYSGIDPLFYSDAIPLSADFVARPVGSLIGFSVLGDLVYQHLGALAYSVLMPLLNAIVLGLMAGAIVAAGQRIGSRFWRAT